MLPEMSEPSTGNTGPEIDPGAPELACSWGFGGRSLEGTRRQGPRPSRAAARTFLTQQTPVHVTHPQQGEPTREIEDARPAVPVQEQGAYGPRHQRPGTTGRGVAGTLASLGCGDISETPTPGDLSP